MEEFNPLNMMCEVVMDEDGDDNALRIGSDDARELPPIPTFDLQSEQFTYLPVQQKIRPLIPPPPLKPSPTAQKKIAARGNVTPRMQANRAVGGPRIMVKSVQDLNDTDSESAEKRAFIEQLLSREGFRKVYESPDHYPKNLSQTTADEIKYYSDNFIDTSKSRFCKLHCTSCQKHIGMNSSNMRSHRMLAVLSCKSCYEFYGDGKFPTDKTDNTEIYCRWCGQGGEQVCCSYCPKVFCYKCVKNNFGINYLDKIQEVSDWACFCCAQMPLWPLRAIARAVMHYVRNCETPLPETCCKMKGRPRKILPKEASAPPPPPPPPMQQVRKPMVVFHQNVLPSPGRSPRIVQYRSQAPVPTIMRTRPAAVSPRMAAINNSVRPRQPASIHQPVSMPSRPAILRTQQPVVHVPPRQVPVSMPEVYVDHSLQDHMVVRLRMPNNKEQYLRVNVTGSCMKTPTLSGSGPIHTQALRHGFRVVKLGFNRLMSIKQQGDNGASSEQQLNHVLEMVGQWKSAVETLENDLKRNVEVFKRQNSKNEIVIDVEDDEPDQEIKWEFEQKARDLFVEDTEVEIIDCETSPQGKRKTSFTDEVPSAKKTKTNGDLPNGEIIEEADPLSLADLAAGSEKIAQQVVTDAGNRSNDDVTKESIASEADDGGGVSSAASELTANSDEKKEPAEKSESDKVSDDEKEIGNGKSHSEKEKEIDSASEVKDDKEQGKEECGDDSAVAKETVKEVAEDSAVVKETVKEVAENVSQKEENSHDLQEISNKKEEESGKSLDVDGKMDDVVNNECQGKDSEKEITAVEDSNVEKDTEKEVTALKDSSVAKNEEGRINKDDDNVSSKPDDGTDVDKDVNEAGDMKEPLDDSQPDSTSEETELPAVSNENDDDQREITAMEVDSVSAESEQDNASQDDEKSENSQECSKDSNTGERTKQAEPSDSENQLQTKDLETTETQSNDDNKSRDEYLVEAESVTSDQISEETGHGSRDGEQAGLGVDEKIADEGSQNSNGSVDAMEGIDVAALLREGAEIDLSARTEQTLLDEIEEMALDSHDIVSDDALHEPEITAS